ncbi:hypothetical protein evm_011886 [Chilo suppressalis]|nr:hypothetical protein evm_011886 [Chilo suppressalis]
MLFLFLKIARCKPQDRLGGVSSALRCDHCGASGSQRGFDDTPPRGKPYRLHTHKGYSRGRLEHVLLDPFNLHGGGGGWGGGVPRSAGGGQLPPPLREVLPVGGVHTLLSASRKLGVLNKVRRFFTPDQLCLLYKTQVRSCVEYCSHLWDGSAKYLLDALDRLQRCAIRIIGDEEVTKHLEPLQLRRDVASLSAFYRLYHGECSEELFSLIPPSPFL